MRRLLLAVALVASVVAGCVGEPPSGVRDEFDASVPHCVGECKRVVDGSPARAWEPFIAIDPKDPDHIVIAHSDLPTDVDGIDYHIGKARVSVSEDGGATWETHIAPSGVDEGPLHPLAPYTHVGWQPTLVFLPDGTLVMSAFATSWVRHPAVFAWQAQTLYTSRSTDGGLTWGDVRIVDQGEGWSVSGVAGGVTQGRSASLGGLAMGPDETLLLVWSQYTVLHPDDGFDPGGGGRLVFASSDDGGLTWSPVRIVDAEGAGYGPSPVIGQDGVRRVAYVDFASDKLRFAESQDNGETWDARTIGAAYLKPVMRAQTLTSGVERLLLTYTTRSEANPDEFQIEFTSSDDGGATWAPALVIDTPEGEGIPMPQVVGSRGDGAWVTFLDIDGQHARYVARKVVDGVVGAPLVLDEMDIVVWGHYMGLAATPDGDAIAAWATYEDGEYDLVWARITGGDEPVAQPIVLPAVPAGLDEPVKYEFTGHVNFPAGCYAESDPALRPVVRDRMYFDFEVPPNTRFVNGTLEWATTGPTPETTDLDLFLYDSREGLYDAASGAKPETFSFELHAGDEGPWTALVHNCQNPPTDFTLSLELS